MDAPRLQDRFGTDEPLEPLLVTHFAHDDGDLPLVRTGADPCRWARTPSVSNCGRPARPIICIKSRSVYDSHLEPA